MRGFTGGYEEEEQKLLIISAHGIPKTGTLVFASYFEQINWYEFSPYFKVLPKNLVIYISACFGIYPLANAIRDKSLSPPFIIGPLVDIRFDHANEIQRKIITKMSEGKVTKNWIEQTISTFNDPNRYPTSYGGRFVLGFYDKDGQFFPQEAIGQFAGPVETNGNFTIHRKISVNGSSDATHFILMNKEDGKLYRILISDLIEVPEDLDLAIGASFKAGYQVVNESSKYPQIVPLKPRKH